MAKNNKSKNYSSKGNGRDSAGRPWCRSKTWSRSGRDETPRRDRRNSKIYIQNVEL